MKNPLFHLKAVKTGTHKAEDEASPRTGAKTNSFGSATLLSSSIGTSRD
jgi:hypothetical protein